MSGEEIKYDLIESYLKGKLKGQDLVAFEEKLGNDAEFRAEVEIQKAGRSVLENSYLKATSESIRNGARAYQKRQLMKKLFGGLGLAGTATILLIVFWPARKVEKDKITLSTSDTTSIPEKHQLVSKIDTHESHTVHHIKAENARLHETEPVQVIKQEKVPVKEVKADSNQLSAEGSIDSVVEEPVNLKEKQVDEQPLDKITEKDNQIEKEPKPTNKTKPVINFHVKESNYKANNGQIRIETSDQRNLTYQIDGLDWFSTGSVFESLVPGNHMIVAKDEAGIEYTYTLNVNESACMMKKDYAFNMNYDDSWNVPLAEEYQGVVMLLDKSGNQVFARNFDKFSKVSWDGTTTDGGHTGVGLHKVIIKYQHGETCVYNVLVEE